MQTPKNKTNDRAAKSLQQRCLAVTVAAVLHISASWSIIIQIDSYSSISKFGFYI